MLDINTRRLFAVAAVALRYPERDWLRAYEDLEFRLDELSPEVGQVLWNLQTYFGSKSLMELQMEYVNVFDRKRRACLYMSYYLNGDTRRRGMALLNFKQTFAQEGWKPAGEELDDYLPMLLEFISVTASPMGLALLAEHKAGVALLELALRDLKSPYQGIVAEILKVIPGEDSPKTLKLIAEGPPTETVGLAPYGQKVGVTC